MLGSNKEERKRKVIWVTISTSYTSNLLRLRKYFDYSNESLHILGMKDERVSKTGWKFGYKLIFLKEFLTSENKSNSFPPDIGETDLLVYFDANDVIPNFGERGLSSEKKEEFIKTWEEFNSPIVFSGMWLFNMAFSDYADPGAVSFHGRNRGF